MQYEGLSDTRILIDRKSKSWTIVYPKINYQDCGCYEVNKKYIVLLDHNSQYLGSVDKDDFECCDEGYYVEFQDKDAPGVCLLCGNKYNWKYETVEEDGKLVEERQITDCEPSNELDPKSLLGILRKELLNEEK